MATLKFRGQTEAEQDAARRMYTYYSYVRSWNHCSGSSAALSVAQKKLPGFQRLKRRTLTPAARIQALRGIMTVQAMNALPVAEHPELAVSANLWVPVQAYYAIHGLGLAILELLNGARIRRHRNFLMAASDQIFAGLMPHPLNVRCAGDPTAPGGTGLSYPGTGLDAKDVVAFSNLTNPSDAEHPLVISKSLETTRSRQLDEIFSATRERRKAKGRRRRNLRAAEKQKLIGGLVPTSIADFLFRLRIRSNYDDPTMLLTYSENCDAAAAFYVETASLVTKISGAFEAILGQLMGDTELSKIKAQANR